MDVSALTSMIGVQNNVTKTSNTIGLNAVTGNAADGTMFDAILNSAIGNISQTNSYLSDAENQEILYALGETDSTHDLTIALEKASTALQYTVAIRDRLLDAYKEIMQIQI